MPIGATSSFPAARRRELLTELQPLVIDRSEHPWRDAGRGAGAGNRWDPTQDRAFFPLRIERVVEVKYDHIDGGFFRHPATFLRWRPDREPRSCTFEQLAAPGRSTSGQRCAKRAEEAVAVGLAEITSGGLILSTLSSGPSVEIRIRSRLSASLTSAASRAAGRLPSSDSSTPMNRPSPRTSPTSGWSISRSPRSSCVPRSRAAACSRSSFDHVEHGKADLGRLTGLPPNVLKYSIPVTNDAAISGVVITAASGWPLPAACRR